MGKVTKSTAEVGRLLTEISQASREQSTGIEEVNTAIGEMEKVVQQNAAMPKNPPMPQWNSTQKPGIFGSMLGNCSSSSGESNSNVLYLTLGFVALYPTYSCVRWIGTCFF